MKYRKRSIPEATRRAVALAAGGIPGEETVANCHYCDAGGRIVWARLYSGRPGAWVIFPGLELHHAYPERLGGSGEPDNIVLACVRCNRSKGCRV